MGSRRTAAATELASVSLEIVEVRDMRGVDCAGEDEQQRNESGRKLHRGSKSGV